MKVGPVVMLLLRFQIYQLHWKLRLIPMSFKQNKNLMFREWFYETVSQPQNIQQPFYLIFYKGNEACKYIFYWP